MPNGNDADRFDQWSATTNFSGALSWGNCGMFACAFDQGDHWGSRRFVPTNLTFCKSVFAFDGILVSLGSGIGSRGDYADDRITATNLFQALEYKGKEAPVFNGKKLKKGDVLLPEQDKDNWLVTPCATGYLLPETILLLSLMAIRLLRDQKVLLQNHLEHVVRRKLISIMV